jgi:hypothetical protein
MLRDMPNLFESFASGGFSLQAPPVRSLLGIAAAITLSGGSPGAETLRRPGALAPEAYTMLVSQVQDAIDEDVGYGRIVVLDRSASQSAETERLVERVPSRGQAMAASLGDEPAAFNATIQLDRDGGFGFRRPYEVESGMTCIVGGAQPGAVGGEALGAGPGDLPSAGAQRWALWREVGHCLVGASRPAAEAFAALVAYRSGDAEIVARVAALPDSEGEEPGLRSRTLAAVSRIASEAPPTGSLAALAAIADRLAAPARPAPSQVRSAPAASEAPIVGVSMRSHPAPEPDEDEDEEDAAPGPRRS